MNGFRKQSIQAFRPTSDKNDTFCDVGSFGNGRSKLSHFFSNITTEPYVDFFLKKKSLVDTTRTKHKFFGKLV